MESKESPNENHTEQEKEKEIKPSDNNCPQDPKEKGSAPKCQGCPYRQQCLQAAKSTGPSIEEQVKIKLQNVKNIILILSGKGGVGKSTIASQLALGLSKKDNLQIGLLDVDICGPSIPRMMGLENEEIKESPQGMLPVYKEQNLAIMSIGYMLKDKKTPVIWRGPRKNGLIKEFFCNTNWDKLDYLIIDTPPGTSDEHLTLTQYLKTSNIKGAIIITTPQEISLLDVRKEINFCHKTNVKVLGVIENMAGFVCPHCNKLTDIFEANTGGGEGLCKEFNLNLLGRLPLEPKILQSSEKGNYFPDSFPETETSKEIAKIVDKILKI
jgi:Mrp family chromosome partitioning ATPase